VFLSPLNYVIDFVDIAHCRLPVIASYYPRFKASLINSEDAAAIAWRSHRVVIGIADWGIRKEMACGISVLQISRHLCELATVYVIVLCSTSGLAKICEGACPNLSVNIEESVSVSHGKFEEQNMLLGPSIIIIFYCLLITWVISKVLHTVRFLFKNELILLNTFTVLCNLHCALSQRFNVVFLSESLRFWCVWLLGSPH
jgi:hypothetical protein